MLIHQISGERDKHSVRATALVVMASLIAGVPITALAQAAKDKAQILELLQSKTCLTCHAVDTKVVGPAFVDIAKRYKDRKDAEDLLAGRIVRGSWGEWGEDPMPPNHAITDAEAHALARHILTLSKP